jgi:hypothetical protein
MSKEIPTQNQLSTTPVYDWNGPNPGFYTSDNHPNSDNHGFNPVDEPIIFSARRRGFLNAYIDGEIGVCLHVHTWFPSLNSKVSNLAFVFQKSSADCPHVSKPCAYGKSQFGRKVKRKRPDNVQSSVSVFSRPSIQNQQTPVVVTDHKGSRYIRSVVRLYCLDERPTLLREWSDLFCKFQEPIRLGAYGKLQTASVGRNLFSRVNDGSGVDAGIESSPQLIEEFSELEGEASSKITQFWGDLNSSCPVMIDIHIDGIQVTFKDVIPRLGEGFAVGFCAANSIPAALKWVHSS